MAGEPATAWEDSLTCGKERSGVKVLRQSFDPLRIRNVNTNTARSGTRWRRLCAIFVTEKQLSGGGALRHSNVIYFLGATTPLQLASRWIPNGVFTEYSRACRSPVLKSFDPVPRTSVLAHEQNVRKLQTVYNTQTITMWTTRS